MRESRNPFRLRASEYIESDATFLRLFGPDALDPLPSDGLWDRVQIFRSAPGGGKTSLLRLFTPPSLITLHESRSSEDLRVLYRRLQRLEVVDDDGPKLLGVMLSCAHNYAALEDLEFDQGRKDRLLHALLNARVVLAALRGASALRRLEYPRDLNRLQIHLPENAEFPARAPSSGSGRDLYDWARAVEERVCRLLDSFATLEELTQVLLQRGNAAALDPARQSSDGQREIEFVCPNCRADPITAQSGTEPTAAVLQSPTSTCRGNRQPD